MPTAFHIWYSRASYFYSYEKHISEAERHCHVDTLWVVDNQKLWIPLYYRKRIIKPKPDISITTFMMADYWDHREELQDRIHFLENDEFQIVPKGSGLPNVVFMKKVHSYIGKKYEPLFQYPITQFATWQHDENKTVYLNLQELTTDQLTEFAWKGYYDLYYDLAKQVLNVCLHR